MRSKKIWYLVLAGVIVVAIVIAGVLYNASQQQKQTTTQPSQNTNNSNQNNGSNVAPTPSDQTPKNYPVSVYFSKHPDSDDDPSKVFALSRTSPDSGVGTFALKELIKGPTTAETSQNYFSTVKLRSGDSTCSGQDFTLTIKDKVATLTFCRQFDHLGVVADGQAESALKATLTQFSTVEKVVILNSSGNCEFDLSGMNLCKK